MVNWRLGHEIVESKPQLSVMKGQQGLFDYAVYDLYMQLVGRKAFK